MTCALLRRHEAAAAPTPAQVRSAGSRLVARMRGDDGAAQFARFVLVGGISSLLYALLFVLLDGFGDQAANIAGAIASSMLANELHRRLTFHAGERVSWFAAQWEGGGLAVVRRGVRVDVFVGPCSHLSGPLYEGTVEEVRGTTCLVCP